MGKRLMQSEEMTEIVEVPAIAVNGEIKVQTPELRRLNASQLKEWATVMGGEVLYIKMRITYTECETQFCCATECWNLPISNTLWCQDHTNKPHQVTQISARDSISPVSHIRRPA